MSDTTNPLWWIEAYPWLVPKFQELVLQKKRKTLTSEQAIQSLIEIWSMFERTAKQEGREFIADPHSLLRVLEKKFSDE